MALFLEAARRTRMTMTCSINSSFLAYVLASTPHQKIPILPNIFTWFSSNSRLRNVCGSQDHAPDSTEGRRRGAIFRRTFRALKRIRRCLKTDITCDPGAGQTKDVRDKDTRRQTRDRSTVPSVEDVSLPCNCQTSTPLLSSVMCMLP